MIDIKIRKKITHRGNLTFESLYYYNGTQKKTPIYII